jgi:tetratricopeptide (TPR) repeat protein
MVFEDLHFADPGLLDFIDHLLDWARTVPITVVTLARPELIEKRPNWGAGKRSFVSLFLEPLPEPAMRELLRGLVPGLPDGAVGTIVSRADGIPLYAVETVRMLVNDGRLSLVDGIYVPTGDLTTLAVPETLTALIASRLDGLDSVDRTLIQDAAVLGQSFSLAGLAAVSGHDETELAARLHGLVRRELLTLESDPRSPERGQYVFVQALIREVAYNTLARKERRSRHLAAARYFEAIGSDELAGALARHYLAAYQNTSEGPEAAALATQARFALTGAAARASSLGAHEQALELLQEALGITEDDEGRAGLLGRAGEAAASAGLFETAEEHLRRALELRRVSGDRSAIAAAVETLGRILLDGGRGDQALAILEAGSAEFSDRREDPAVVALDAQLARLYMRTDRFEEALAAADRVLATAEHQDLVPVIADTLVTRGSALVNVNQTRQGLGLIMLARELAEREGLVYVASRALSNEVGLLNELDPGRGLASAEQLIQLGRRAGLRFMIVAGASASAWALLHIGDWDRAAAQLAAALDESLDPSAQRDLWRSDIELAAHRGVDVTSRVEEYERLVASMSTDIRARSDVVDLKAAVALAGGDLPRAHELALASHAMVPWAWALSPAARAAVWQRDVAGVRHALGEFDGLGIHGPMPDAEGRVIRAALAALEGRRDEALALYRDTLRRWRDLGLAWREALTIIDMATLLGPAEPEVTRGSGPAREILARIGATPYLARLDAALEASPAAEGPRGTADLQVGEVLQERA